MHHASQLGSKFSKWITGGRASQQWWLKEAPFTDSTQAHDNLRVRRLIEEMQHPLILIPHCIAISAMLGRPYLGRSGRTSPRDFDF